jgi:hypothetical protein
MIPFKLIIILTLVVLASCTKNHSCFCTSGTQPQIDIEAQVYHDTKKNAQKKCTDFQDQAKTASVPDLVCTLRK